MKKNIKSQAPYKPESNMPRQAVPALIGKYKIMLCQRPGCSYEFKQSPAQKPNHQKRI
jgi:hypothetical protein